MPSTYLAPTPLFSGVLITMGAYSSIIRTGEMFFRHDICTALLTQVFEGESGSETSETWYHWKAHEME